MNFYSLPQPRQRMIAGLLLAGVAAAAAVLAVLPAMDHVRAREGAIRAAEADLARWQGIAASRAVLQAGMNDPEAAARSAALTLPASTEAQAAATVQATIRRILSDASADLKSIQPLESRSRGSLQESGVRIVALATQRQLDAALFAIEHSSPRLFVREANIQVSGATRRPGDVVEEPVLQVRLDVFAFALRETD
ncbi:type II secretion system protein GspM [Hyphomonas sp.]|uniref:type II secretion system protein GspM n=1 Tax=Hyphomonas sp. TaxID=87 RepID=UPI0039192E1A